MIAKLNYGLDRVARLELRDEQLLALCAAPHAEPLSDVSDSTRRALLGPVGFPALDLAVAPGDKIVLAIENDLPRAAEIVRATLEVLAAAGVETGDVTLLTEAGAQGQALRAVLAEHLNNQAVGCAWQTHEPGDRQSLSYLAASANANPIYVNRALHEADLVIPIGTQGAARQPGYFGVSSTLFPRFSDSAAVARFRRSLGARGPKRRRLRQEADEVRWLLGVQFAIQVVPGAGDEVLHVLAGEAGAVHAQGKRAYERSWSCDVPTRAALVVAAIAGDDRHQTWDQVGRALWAARQVADDEGGTILCTSLAEPPGVAVKELAASDDPQGALRQVRRHAPPDMLAALELAAARSRGPVYLISRLEDEVVEDLGLSPLVPARLSQVASRFRSCIVLANAQHAVARLRDERAPRAEHNGKRPT